MSGFYCTNSGLAYLNMNKNVLYGIGHWYFVSIINMADINVCLTFSFPAESSLTYVDPCTTIFLALKEVRRVPYWLKYALK
jgi:hypothetical protein